VADAVHGPDIVVECTGAAQVVIDAAAVAAPQGIVCLAGVSSGQRRIEVDVGSLNNALVLENNVVFGSVNANRRHYLSAHRALQRADRDWLASLITRRVPFEAWQAALEARPGDIKVVLDFPAREEGDTELMV
jgi:threonine dehydrogenase-like Zn-dependent dehydrogenase